MKNIATIVSNPENFQLNEVEVGSVVDYIQASGGIIEDVTELSAGEAYDIKFAVLPVGDAYDLLKEMLQSVPVDFCVQPDLENRQKQLLLADMDSTTIAQECLDELAREAGFYEQTVEITERAMNGEMEFNEALTERVRLIKGLDEGFIQQVIDKLTINEGIKDAVQIMNSSGARTVLISGGFTHFTSYIGGQVGYAINEANVLEIKDGKLTGEVIPPILDGTAKLTSLKGHCEDLDIGLSDAVCVGDGSNDLPMMEACGLGVAYKAKPAVKERVKTQINHTSLKSLAFFQGYRV